jgi:uncharacterized protein with FMN-binding domain
VKKYFQITFFLSAFFLLVLAKNLKGNDEESRVVMPGSITQTPTSTPAPTSSQPPLPTATPATRGKYKDGTYTGKVADAYYGLIQVQAVIKSGKINDVIFLQYPNDNRTSLSINSQAMPVLKSEAIQAQSAKVDIVSGASDSSPAFIESLASALSQAQ